MAFMLLCGNAWAAPEIELVVNGRRVVTNPGVVVEGGRSYGPLRAVVEAVGGTVDWQEKEQAADICKGDRCVRIRAAEGIIREGRLLIPLRLMAESLGAEVQWTDSPPRVRIRID